MLEFCSDMNTPVREPVDGSDRLDITFITKPQVLVEAVELICLAMHHESYDDLKHRILLTYGAKYDAEQEQLFSARLDFLEQLQERAETLLDFQNPRLRYFFERHATSGSSYFCLATVLITSFHDVKEDDLDRAVRAMKFRKRLLIGQGFEISDISYSGLSFCRCSEGQPPALHEQINRLDCSPEFKWKIMTGLCAYDSHLEELLALMKPVCDMLSQELEKLEPLLEPVYAYWRASLERHTLKELLQHIGPGQGEAQVDCEKLTVRFWRTACNRMYLGENWTVPGEVVAYIGIIVELDDAADGSQVSDQVICSMLRVIGDNSKFAILKLLRAERMYGQEIGERLGLHHGTVSRHLSALYHSGLVSMEKGNGRVCYYTINRKGMRRLLEVMAKLFLEETPSLPVETQPAEEETRGQTGAQALGEAH